ncbi:MAG TPA: peptidylprolyl isomerase [Stellaceae bacterium]|nr:peptidylprolyl isomerase [Stellaceae bacterium]
MFLRCMIVALLLLGVGALPAEAKDLKHESTAAHKKEAAAKHEAAPADDPVVARVNGTAIHRSDVLALKATLPPQAQQQPFDQLYPRLVNQLVAMTLVDQQARKARLNDEPNVKRAIALSDAQILQDAYFDGIMKKEITQAKLRARYAEYLKTAPSVEEVHARHILVPTEAEAKEIIQELKKGADFATLAREKTTDPAGKTTGGDLGYFTENEMVPAFAKAAFALKKGQFSQTPVKTQFGWHVIKVEDRRKGKAASYEEIAPQLARQMAQQIYGEKVKTLAAASKIEIFNADGSPRTPAAPAAAAHPPAGPVVPQLIPTGNGAGGASPAPGGPPVLAPGTEGLSK